MKRGTKTVSVIGLGYMGIPTASLIAQAGFKVVGVDLNREKVESLQKGKLPFKENGLDEVFKKAFKNMSFSTKPVEADVFIIAVPTPITPSKKMDVSFVAAAAKSIIPVLKKGNLVILESTVAPGTCAGVLKDTLDKASVDYLLAHCPERAFPGETLKEMVYNHRIIGGIDQKSTKAAESLYKTFVKGKILLTDATTAEAAKLLENSFRSVNIAFANEIAKLSHKIGINAWEAIELANYHPRVNILNPGPGVGGHCIPVDPWFLIEIEKKDTELLKKSLITNDSMPGYVADLIHSTGQKNKLGIKKVGVLGVSYKKNVDDTRESPSEMIIDKLLALGYEVRCADLHVKKFHHPIYKESDILKWADAIVIATDHDAYKTTLKFLGSSAKVVLDTRNSLTKKQIKDLSGKKVVTLGKGN